MKIVITNEGEDYNIYKGTDIFPLRNLRAANFAKQYAFYDDDIENLIGEKQFTSSWVNGKCEYNISLNHLQLITGERGAKNRAEIGMYEN